MAAVSFNTTRLVHQMRLISYVAVVRGAATPESLFDEGLLLTR
jgi:hypothetical protein